MSLSKAFSVFRAEDSAERSQWLDYWEKWPEREVWCHPGFVELFLGPGERAICATWQDPDEHVLYPLILRRIPRELAGGHPLFDLIGPYGYGGPFLWGTHRGDGKLFWQALANWCRENGVVSLFSRLALFRDQLVPNIPGCVFAGENIVRSLEHDESYIWMDYEHKVRKNVKRARRDGIVVRMDSNHSYVDDFLRIYSSTMERRSAGAVYRIDRNWLDRAIVSVPGSIVFFHAWSGDKIVSTEMVLVSKSRIYSFLGGTLSSHFSSRPNDLLKHEIISWARGIGKKYYVLGGGFLSGKDKGGDGIFRYKRSFAPNGIMSFRVMNWIIDRDRYSSLVESRRRLTESADEPWKPRDGFFPRYRA